MGIHMLIQIAKFWFRTLLGQQIKTTEYMGKQTNKCYNNFPPN